MKRNVITVVASVLLSGITAFGLVKAYTPDNAGTGTTIVNSDGSSYRTVNLSMSDYPDFTYAAENSVDAVVFVKVKVKMQQQYIDPLGYFFGFGEPRSMERVQEGSGSGVIIRQDGYIVTNNHVVQDAARITVTLNDKRVLQARLVGTDPATDLAVIKIEPGSDSESSPDAFSFLEFGNSEAVRIGEAVLAIGNPFNLTSTVTAGIISAKARNMNIIQNTTGESTIESFLQTDAAVNSGNSGGALVNCRGELIGINTAIASGNGYYTGYSFAVPSNIARKVSVDLRKYGVVQRGYLGVNVAEMDADLVRKKGLDGLKGVYIGRVIPQCAADRAGLQAGDIILSVNDVEINSYAEMMEEVGYYYPGDEVSVTYHRSGKTYTKKLTLLNSNGTTDVVTK